MGVNTAARKSALTSSTMINYVLGAPGSGKSLIVPRLRGLLPDRVVLDWDALMGPAGELAGAPIPQTPQTWEPYGRLVRAVAELVFPADMVLLGVCTPDEMTDWPNGPWILLDCSDDVRRQRLIARHSRCLWSTPPNSHRRTSPG